VTGRTAILIVNGFDRIGLWGTNFEERDALTYPWIELCLREVRRRSVGSEYDVFVWDNSQMPALRAVIRSHGARLYPSEEQIAAAGGGKGSLANSLVLIHAASLQKLLDQVGDEFEYVVTLDTDAFPIQEGWIEQLKRNLEATSLTGVWRDEMTLRLGPFVHPSCLAIRRARLLQLDQPFSFAGVQDVGQRITYEVLEAGERIMPLARSNARNPHFLIGGIYGDLIYHQAAGSRRPIFRLTEGEDRDARIYEALRDAVFRDVDHTMAVLRGVRDDDLNLEWERTEPRIRIEWPGPGLREALDEQEASNR
jgi:hypothetical protein